MHRQPSACRAAMETLGVAEGVNADTPAVEPVKAEGPTSELPPDATGEPKSVSDQAPAGTLETVSATETPASTGATVSSTAEVTPPPDALETQISSEPFRLLPNSKWKILKSKVRMMNFVQRVGKMAAHARPSKLQVIATQPTHGIAHAVVPAVNDDGTRVVGFETVTKELQSSSGAPKQSTPKPEAVTTFAVTFSGALDVPDAGIDRDIEYVLLRAAMFETETNNFIGNVSTVLASTVTDAAGVVTWRFGFELSEEQVGNTSDSVSDTVPEDDTNYHLLGRTSRNKNTMGTMGGAEKKNPIELRVELNVVPKPSEFETGLRGQSQDGYFNASPFGAAPLKKKHSITKKMDEITVAWGVVDLPTGAVNGGITTDVTLRGGDRFDEVELTQSKEAKKTSNSFFSTFTSKGQKLKKGPCLSVTIAPVPLKHQTFVEILPKELLCVSQLVPMLATYREACSDEVNAVGGNIYATACNHILCTVPQLLQDPQIKVAMYQAWRRATGKWSILDKKNPTKRKEALESLALKFWPLLHINALPDSDDANAGDSNARVSRVQVIDRYTAEHPVEALSKHPSDWLHAPFNVKELAHNFSDAAEFYL